MTQVKLSWVANVALELIAEYLVPRVNSGRRLDLTEISGWYVKPGYSDGTIVTASSAHSLVTPNREVRRALMGLSSAQSMVRPVIGNYHRNQRTAVSALAHHLLDQEEPVRQGSIED